MKFKFRPNQTIKQMIKFCFVAGLAGGTQWLVYFLFEYFGTGVVLLQIGYAVSVACACIVSFIVNRKFTFQHRGQYWRILAHGAFYAVMILSLTPLLGLLVKKGVNPYLVNAINGAISMVVEFLFLKFLLFRKKRATVAVEPDQELPLPQETTPPEPDEPSTEPESTPTTSETTEQIDEAPPKESSDTAQKTDPIAHPKNLFKVRKF